ncbi:unnamed protein product [Polarella glacialis]|uniref:Uncharacterized protein n=1 Tax=Polarella glacialis TaxID=89957 RepID=A0A813DKX7_POLGL|nr:unnamed protein product [Polarella glacialis]
MEMQIFGSERKTLEGCSCCVSSIKPDVSILSSGLTRMFCLQICVIWNLQERNCQLFRVFTPDVSIWAIERKSRHAASRALFERPVGGALARSSEKRKTHFQRAPNKKKVIPAGPAARPENIDY